MGAKVSKQDHVIEQRFNYLKSMASDVSDFINNYEGDEGQASIRKIPGFTESIRLDKSITKLNLKSSRKKRTSIAVKDADPDSLAEYNKDSSQDFDYYAHRNNRAIVKKNSGKLQLSLVGDYMNFNLNSLTPKTFMKQAKTKLDEEMRGTLQGLINKANATLEDIKIYLHSEIPLEDEKTMEEKSCKVVDKSKDQGFEDYESPIANRHFGGEDEGYDGYENSKSKLYDRGIAVTCRKGEAADVPNQDNYFVYIDAYTKVYTIYDGHGPFGNLVSHFVCIHFAKALLEEPIYLIDPVGAIKQAMVKAEAALLAHTQKKDTPFDVHLSGTCATVVVQRSNMLYIGQLGDSKVMIGRKNKNKKGMSLEQLTYDHVPYSLEEKKRIYTKGGEVRIWNGDGEERVFVKGRVYPCLATTRSIGDEIGSLIGIISEPEISTVELNSATDVFLLIGSSAMFTYLDDNEILNVMNYANSSKIRETADILVKKAKNSWVQNENNIEDMTLIISYF